MENGGGMIVWGGGAVVHWKEIHRHVHTECSSRRYFNDVRHRHVGSAGRRWRILLRGPLKKLPVLGHCFERCCSRDEAVSHILVYSAWYRCDKGLDLSVSMIVGHGMYA